MLSSYNKHTNHKPSRRYWFLPRESHKRYSEFFFIFVAVFLGCTSTARVGLCFLWFCVRELPKAELAVILVLKRLRRRGNGLKSHPTDWEKPGIEPATPGLQDIGLSPTPRPLSVSLRVLPSYNKHTNHKPSRRYWFLPRESHKKLV